MCKRHALIRMWRSHLHGSAFGNTTVGAITKETKQPVCTHVRTHLQT